MAVFKPGDRVTWADEEWEVREGPDPTGCYSARRVSDGRLRSAHGDILTPVLPSLVEACEALRACFHEDGMTRTATVGEQARRAATVAMFAALDREQGRG